MVKYLLPFALGALVAAAVAASRDAHAAWPPPSTSCAQLTADWPLWSVLSKSPWTAKEIRQHHYSDEPRPRDVLSQDAAGAFVGHGADEGLSYSPASLALIAHMLAAPTKAVCGDPVGEPLRLSIDTLIHRYAPVEYSGGKLDRETADPVLAAFEALELSKFKGRGRSEVSAGEEQDWVGGPTEDAALDFAKARWQSDGNPLWAVAILEHTRDPSDVAIIDGALKALRQWPNLPASAKARYAWRLTAQRVRLQLVEGHLAEAADASRLLAAADREALQDDGAHPDVRAAADLIVNAGTRWFLRRNDRPSARGWAMVAAKGFRSPVGDELKPLLVQNLDELLGRSALGLDRSGGIAELGPGRALLDTLSSGALIRLSRRPGLAAGDRRAMVGAAWTRAFALKHWDDVSAWVPDLRRAFPEIAEDVRRIEGAHDDVSRRHLVVWLLVKTPGLVAIPSWARPPGGPERSSAIDKARPQHIAAFDLENPNDGNWWCELDPDEIEWESASIVVDRAHLRDASSIPWGRRLPVRGREATAYQRAQMLAETTQKRAAYPAFLVLSARDREELARLSMAGSAVKRLTDEALRWASEYRRGKSRAADRPLLAETLAKAVLATRYACHKGINNGRWSSAAFNALQSLFPKSRWAASTRYWYGRPTPPQPAGRYDSRGLQLGIKLEYPAGTTTCPGDTPPIEFLVPPTSCDAMDEEARRKSAAGYSPPTLTFALLPNEVAAGDPPAKRATSNAELVTLHCPPHAPPLPSDIKLFDQPLVGCRIDEGTNVELRAMTLYYTPAQEVAGHEDRMPKTVVLFDLKTTVARADPDIETLRNMTAAAINCLPSYMQMFENATARADNRSAADLAKKFGLPICPG